MRAAVELDGGDVLSGGGGGVDGAAARAPRRAARGEAAEEEEPSAKALGIAMKCVTFAFGKFRRNVQQVCPDVFLCIRNSSTQNKAASPP